MTDSNQQTAAPVARPKRRAPRQPVPVTDAQLDAAFEALAGGSTLSEHCRGPGRPDRRSIVRRIADDPELQRRFSLARNTGYDALAEEVLLLVDQPIPKDQNGRTDVGLVQQRRLQADVRLRLLSKWCTARYGDRLEVAGTVGPLVIITGLPQPSESVAARRLLGLDDHDHDHDLVEENNK